MKIFKKFRIYDLVVISLMAALGLAVKIIVTPLAHMISGPLNMPGGALAGGFYMFWIVLAGALVGKRGAATLTALIQALIVIVVGSVGSHGIMSIVTYTLPGLMVDLVFLVLRREIKTNMDFFIGGMVANMTGTFLTGMVFFRLPLVTMVMIVASGMLSGGLGGLIAYVTYKGVKQMDHMDSDDEELGNKKQKKSYRGLLIFIGILLVCVLVYFFGDKNGEEILNDSETSTEERQIPAENIGELSLDMMQPLLLTGDLVRAGYIDEYSDLLSLETYSKDGMEGQRIETTILLNALEFRSEQNKIYLIGNDGFMVGLDESTLEDTYVAYNPSNGWQFISDKHPVNSGIKQIVEIVVVSESKLEDFNFIFDGENHFYSYGQMRMLMTNRIQILDGVANLGDIEIDVMKIKDVVPVKDFVSSDDIFMLATENGETIYEYGESGYLEFYQGDIRYHSKDMRTTYHNVLGIMVNPPNASIKDHYSDVQHYLEQDIHVLSIFIDGYSFRQYEALVSDEEEDFMDILEGVQPATVGFKPVTNVGFTTMITGVDPIEHGVHDRSYREPLVPTIFDYCNEHNIVNGLIEGNTQILSLNTETILNLDENGNEITDDEIHETAMDKILDYEYVMVHYHSVDDFGHNYGEIVDETMEELKVIDGYVEELVEQWDGKVIILADHGMHTTEEGGTHGQFRIEDFVVPYVIFDGGSRR
jgi:ABC-type thiamin/hydroxymethylpyrimidine transport system permease subunit